MWKETVGHLVYYLSTGVHQGSSLGPLLGLIYMNDIPNISEEFKYISYAYDTTLFSNDPFDINNQ